FFKNLYTDNPPPQGPVNNPANVKTWTQNTAFSSGQMINNNGNIYQETVASCTSLNSGTGPSGLPAGTTPDSVFTGTISDGTCAWKFVEANNLTWLLNDSFGNSLTVINGHFLDGVVAIQTTDSANTGSSFPTFLSAFDVGADHPFSAGVSLDAGYSVLLVNPFIGSSLTSNGLILNSNHKGEIQVANGRITGNAQYGILIQSGPVNNIITGNAITNNSASGSGSFYGIGVAPGATHTIIKGNRIGPNYAGGSLQQGI